MYCTESQYYYRIPFSLPIAEDASGRTYSDRLLVLRASQTVDGNE